MSDVPPPIDVPPPADTAAATTGGEATLDPTANDIPDVSEAQTVEVNMPASDSQEDMLEWAFRPPDDPDDNPYAPEYIALQFASVAAYGVASEMASALPVVMKGLVMDKVDPAGSLTGTGLEDAIQINALRDAAGAWIRVNAPELAQKLDRVFGKNW
jgi:hypothetical protein